MFSSIMTQLFFSAKPWALIPLKAILAHVFALVLVQFERLIVRRYCTAPGVHVTHIFLEAKGNRPESFISIGQI